MGIKKLYSIGIFLLIIFHLSGCDPLASDNGSAYQFSITAKVSPSKDTVNIGDTLYFSSSFSSQLFDIKTGKLVNYSHAQVINGSIGFNDLTKSLGTVTDSSTTNDFEFIKLIGDVYTDKDMPVYWNSKRTAYEEINGSYNLKVGMIPKKKGVYYFGIADPYSNGLVGSKQFNVNSASFAISFVDTNQQLHYFEDKFGQLSEPYSRQIYCFVVK